MWPDLPFCARVVFFTASTLTPSSTLCTTLRLPFCATPAAMRGMAPLSSSSSTHCSGGGVSRAIDVVIMRKAIADVAILFTQRQHIPCANPVRCVGTRGTRGLLPAAPLGRRTRLLPGRCAARRMPGALGGRRHHIVVIASATAVFVIKIK